MNQLLLGDNLTVLRSLPSESVDVIYLDPPFFSNRTYEQIWGDAGEIRSFEDRWSGGIDHYIGWLKDRVQEMYRILKPTGSLFLHCDWHANAEIKVFILSKIFGEQSFKGEIIWKRHNSHNDAKKKLGVLTDTIFYYTKSDDCTYNPVYAELSEKYKDDFYKLDDRDGRGLYQLADMASPNPRPNMMYEWMGYPCPAKGWRYQKETMQQLHDEGKIYYPKYADGSFDVTKRPRLKRYLKEQKGIILGNCWDDIQNVQAHAKERIGYPTQKPEKLMERIITMASNEGDVVLDAFVGGGTTVVVAERLKRAWIAIDQSVAAVKVTEMRLWREMNLFSSPFVVKLHKYDYDALLHQDPFAFEAWIVEQAGGSANKKQRGDKGVDGRMKDGTPIQVKQSENVGSPAIRQFLTDTRYADKTVFEANKAAGTPVGIVIAFTFSKGAVQEVAKIRNEDGVTIQLLRVDEIVSVAKKPELRVDIRDLSIPTEIHDKQEDSLFSGLREIEFVAHGKSSSGIEFYAWDFKYDGVKFNPEELIDKTGIQKRKLKAGQHVIAVKAVDNDGLEAIEVVRLKVNGEVQRS